VENEIFQTRLFHSPEVALSYVEGPSNGLPLLLLHGMASRWQPFQSILPALAAKYHVFAIDFRGHGQSGHTPDAYRLDDYTHDILQFILHQVQQPVVVYGHSLGALVGINLAAQQPPWVQALILGDPPLFYHDTAIQDTFWQSAFMDLLEFKTAHPDPVEMDAWLAQNYPNMSTDRRAERVQSLQRLDPGVLQSVISNTQMDGISLPALTSRVACQVLLLRGNPDLGSALRGQEVDFATSHFPKISVLEMESVGHGIIPTALLPQLMEFIDTLECD
jgi:pimeloyl-ACP methyl ester carboxylesterase